MQKKMSLANMQGKLSKAEMKNIMAGSEQVWMCFYINQPCNSEGRVCYYSLNKWLCVHRN